MDIDARSLLGTRVILEAFVEPACAATQQPVEISPLLLLDDSLLLFTRFDDCVAAIDIGFGAWGAFRPARRIILAWNPQALEDLIERYARRPHVIGDLPLGDDARPLAPVGPARYAIVPAPRRASVRRDILDAIDRPRVATWRRGGTPDSNDVVVCLDLPSRVKTISNVEGLLGGVVLWRGKENCYGVR